MNEYRDTFRNLVVWQKAKELTLAVYKCSESFPSQEKFGLTSQIRRSSGSVMANIAEGNERRKSGDRGHFFIMAKSSLTEVDCWIELAYELKYVTEENYKKCIELINKTSFLLLRFMEAQK